MPHPRTLIPTCLIILAVIVCTTCARSIHDDRELRAGITQSISEYMSIPNEDMFAPVLEVSPTRPFVFHHIQKAGGTSLRATLYGAAKNLKLTTYIPCYDGVSCHTSSFPDQQAIIASHPKLSAAEAQHMLDSIAVYGGHFSAYNVTERSIGSRKVQSVSCMTNLRDPVDRVVSSAYYFGTWAPLREGHCLNELPIDKLNDILLSNVQTGIVYGYLGNKSNHAFLNGAMLNSIPTKELINVFDSTMKTIARCPPVLLENSMSYDLIKRKFPTLAKNAAFKETYKLKTGKSRDKCPQLDPMKYALIEELVELERLIYHAVQMKIESAHAELFGK